MIQAPTSSLNTYITSSGQLLPFPIQISLKDFYNQTVNQDNSSSFLIIPDKSSVSSSSSSSNNNNNNNNQLHPLNISVNNENTTTMGRTEGIMMNGEYYFNGNDGFGIVAMPSSIASLIVRIKVIASGGVSYSLNAGPFYFNVTSCVRGMK